MVNLVVAELSSTCVKTQLSLPKFFRSPFIFTALLTTIRNKKNILASGYHRPTCCVGSPFSCNIRMVEHRHSRETSVPGNKIGVCNFVFGTP